jgi:dolichol-phosphate mannosyltransferase
MNELKLSVVIPAHNEEMNLPPVLEALGETLRAEGIPYEVIVVNDNSSDGTAASVRECMAVDPAVRTVDRSQPCGFGRAVRAGLEVVTGDVVVVYMADASDHPRDVVAYYRKIEEGYDCVFGSRFMAGSKVTDYPWLKYLVNRVVNRCIQFLFRCPFNDLTNAFKAYRTHVLRESGPFRACHFNITIELSLGALVRRYNIAQIPIGWTGRRWGSSKLRLKEMGRRYLSTLVKILAERMLIADDLLAERLAQHSSQETRRIQQEQWLQELTDRLQDCERRLTSLEWTSSSSKRQAA